MAKKIIFDKNKTINEFLRESNAIEGVYGDDPLFDAMDAWNFAVSQEEMTDNVVLEIHKRLMRRQYPQIAGKWRNCDVWIGGTCKKYVDQALLLWELRIALMAIYSSRFPKTKIPFLMAAKAHVMFEECHPFIDGNGRTGRIIYNWHRMKIGLPIHVIHTGNEQQEYYEWFSGKI